MGKAGFSKLFFLICIVVFCACGKVPLYELGLKVDQFYDGFENGNLNKWVTETVTANSAIIVTNPVHAGSYAVRFTLTPDDYIYNGHRTELALFHCAPYGSEVWYRWSFFIPLDYAESSEWQVIGQWHDQPDFLKGEDWNNINTIHSPPVQLSYKQGKVIVITATPDNVARKIGEVAITKGAWTEVIYRIYWHKNRGRVETWINGSPITPFNGIDNQVDCSTAYNEAGCYFKIGLYRSGEIKSTNVIYYDDVYIGNTKAEVGL